MPKLNKGKTETIKNRAIYVYLSPLEMVEDWKHRAEIAGMYTKARDLNEHFKEKGET
ncbi:hypothetical protein [Candidatus Methanodesulfokora washburnensis]|jgi:hypothetical protein|uniref:hypothetical protein n=1 Tax=Candidatus Methanodesulfokora washburnensis TaxID=2478471 RepID=UPI0013868968|nr:hypothetical protein [Candidatus Methanodesulfokores washburnensis]